MRNHTKEEVALCFAVARAVGLNVVDEAWPCQYSPESGDHEAILYWSAEKPRPDVDDGICDTGHLWPVYGDNEDWPPRTCADWMEQFAGGYTAEYFGSAENAEKSRALDVGTMQVGVEPIPAYTSDPADLAELKLWILEQGYRFKEYRMLDDNKVPVVDVNVHQSKTDRVTTATAVGKHAEGIAFCKALVDMLSKEI